MLDVMMSSILQGGFVLYLLAIVCPPVAVLLTGRPGQALLNLILTCLLIVPGIIHALMVVSEHKSNQRNKKLIKAMRRG